MKVLWRGLYLEVPAFAGKGVEKMSKGSFIGLLIVAAMVAALIRFGPEAWNKQSGSEPQASPVAEAQPPVDGCPYVAQEGDSCSEMARKVFKKVGDEKDVKEFVEANDSAISQEAARRGVLKEDCPIVAGQAYNVPPGWESSGVPDSVATQTQAQSQITVVKNVDIWHLVGLTVVAFASGVFLTEIGLLRFVRLEVRSRIRWPLSRTIRPKGMF
jgi:hypothetical protein